MPISDLEICATLAKPAPRRSSLRCRSTLAIRPLPVFKQPARIFRAVHFSQQQRPYALSWLGENTVIESLPIMSRDSQLAIVLYRSLLSAARSLGNESLRLRLPLNRSVAQWPPRNQQFEMVPARSAARELFPTLEITDTLDSSEGLEPPVLRDIIREEFRKALANVSASAPDHDVVGIGLDAMKNLNEQVALAKCSSFTRTEAPELGAAVVVEAQSCHLGRDGPLHVFTYRLRLYNVGEVPVQVVGRQWEICNSDGSVHASVPRGSPGLVGQTPRLEPGGMAFECASAWTRLESLFDAASLTASTVLPELTPGVRRSEPRPADASGTQLQSAGGSVSGSLQMMSLGPGREEPFDAQVGVFNCKP